MLHIIGTHDNTAANRRNPDPAMWAGFGERSVDDMLQLWINVVYLEQAEFDKLIAEFCAPLIDKSPFCMWMTKMAVNRGLDADTNSLITLETMTCNVVHHSADAREGVSAFLEKRQPVWTGK